MRPIFINMKKLTVILIILVSMFLAAHIVVSASCPHRSRTFCSPAWGPPCCMTASVSGCYSGNGVTLYQEHHSASLRRVASGGYLFAGYYCTDVQCIPEYEYGRSVHYTSVSVSRTYHKSVHLAITRTYAHWMWEPRTWIIQVSVGSGGST